MGAPLCAHFFLDYDETEILFYNCRVVLHTDGTVGTRGLNNNSHTHKLGENHH